MKQFVEPFDIYAFLTYSYFPIVILLVLYKWKDMIYTLPALLLVVHILKISVQKQRPDGSDVHSFPSGHTATAWYIVVLYEWHPLIFIWAILVSISRVVKKRHDAIDVTIGALLGVILPHLRLKG